MTFTAPHEGALGVIMTRKHFEAVAGILESQGADYRACLDFAVYFKDLNPRFDTVRFLTACGH